MKKITIIIAALFISCTAFAQGIEFEKGTFAEALAKAKAENKMVFMDCFTTWCGPCKMMSKEVFPLKDVGDYFNQHFVSLKVDMEKGEGIELAKTYNVQAFPTLLFMDAAGKVVHTKVGGCDGPGLIEEAKIAGDPSRQIGTMHKRFDSGDRNVEFLHDYVKALYAVYDLEKISKIGKEFIQNTPREELSNVFAFTVVGYSNEMKYGSETYKYVIENKEKFIAAEGIGQKNYDGVVGLCISTYLNETAATSTKEELERAITETKKDFVSPMQDFVESNAYNTWYLANKEFDKWFDVNLIQAKESMKTDKMRGASMFIQIAYEITIRPEFEAAEGLAEKAAEEVEKIMKDDPKELPHGYYCLARLYQKTGNKELALKNIDSYLLKTKELGRDVDPRATKLKDEITEM